MSIDRIINLEDFTTLAGEVLSRGGRLRFKARGNSMNPFIRSGDILVVQPIKEMTQLQIGDVLLVQELSSRTVVHRLRSLRRGGLLI